MKSKNIDIIMEENMSLIGRRGFISILGGISLAAILPLPHLNGSDQVTEKKPIEEIIRKAIKEKMNFESIEYKIECITEYIDNTLIVDSKNENSDWLMKKTEIQVQYYRDGRLKIISIEPLTKENNSLIKETSLLTKDMITKKLESMDGSFHEKISNSPLKAPQGMYLTKALKDLFTLPFLSKPFEITGKKILGRENIVELTQENRNLIFSLDKNVVLKETIYDSIDQTETKVMEFDNFKLVDKRWFPTKIKNTILKNGKMLKQEKRKIYDIKINQTDTSVFQI